MIHSVGLVIQYVILMYLCVQVLYLFFFSVTGTFGKKKSYPKAKNINRIRIFIPGYKEDKVIIATAKNAVEHDYPKKFYDVVVIADSFNEATLNSLRKMPLKVVEVNFNKSTKGKALQKAIEATEHDPVDIIVVLDADNNMSPGFLHAVNNAFEAGCEIVQGHRTAKNPQTAFAFLDACTEEINNHIFRRGHVAAGLPSALIGSGMAFKASLFTSLLQNIGDTSGEDKELEFRITRQRKQIAFMDGCYVYDEKVSDAKVFTKQRSRWLATQLEYFQKYFVEGWLQLFKGNIAFFNKVFQTYLLPRVMLITVVSMWLLWVILFSAQFLVVSIILFFLLSTALLAGIPRSWYSVQLLRALVQIPGALISMIRASFQIGQARKKFIHTPHGEAVQNI